MAKRYGRSITPRLYELRVLTHSIKATVISESDIKPQETLLTSGVQIEIIKTDGGKVAFGLLNQRRTSRTQELLMFSAHSSVIFERSVAL